jgi:hypothetical protein
MRPRDRILANLETTYREAYDKARAENLSRRMEELDAAFQRDQLMLEILLDIRELLSQAPAASGSSPGALDRLQALRNLTKPL